MKCVILVDAELPLGLLANTVAVLAISIGNRVNGIVGADVYDQDGTLHPGITEAVVPLLKGNRPIIRQIREKMLTMHSNDLYFVDFCNTAQQSKYYTDYRTKLAEMPEADLYYLGIAIYGPDREINKLTGNIALLR